MIKTGVWLDKKKALIVKLENGKENFFSIQSNVEDYHISGGSGTKAKGGPQDVVQDSKYLEREKHQLKKYFKELVSYLDDAEEIALFGPAGTNEKFSKELNKKYKKIGDKVSEIKKADSMTNNQVVALVKKYFKYL